MNNVSADYKSPRPRRRLFLIPFLGVLVFTLIASVVLERVLSTWYLEKTDSDLQQVIIATRDSIERIGANDDDMSIIVESIGIVTPSYRITIFDLEGKMLADTLLSELDIQSRNLQPKAEELSLALAHRHSMLIRPSKAMGSEALYITERVQTDSFNGFIRVGIRTEDYNAAVRELRFMLFGLACIAITFMAVLVLMFVRYLNKSIGHEQALLECRVEERTEDILLLHRLTNMLAACQSLTEVQSVVQDIVPRIIGPINCSISLVNASRNLVEKKIDWAGSWPGESVFSPEDCWALRKGKHHFSHDQFSAQACHHMGNCKDNTLCVPLLAHGNAIGLLHMIVGNKLSVADHDMAFTIAEHLGLALANLDMQERLRQQATRDPLTSLYNRRHFEDVIEKELSRAHRHHEPVSLISLDIDHFKRFNDNFGHDAGDYVLKSVGLLILDSIRNEDTACRMGGEELSIILPEANVNDAIACAEKLREVISEKHFQLNEISLGTVTVSIGISIYPSHGAETEQIIKAADVALYKAKDNGRNRVEVYDEDSALPKRYCLIKQAPA